MKTTKSVERSLIQMMIVSFVIIFAFITGTILFMYFKWFANDQLGAPAAVNVVGVEKNMVVEEAVVLQTEDEWILGLYDDLPKDMIEEIASSEDFIVFASVLSNKQDKLVYFESNGVDRNIVLLNLVTKEKTVKKLDINYGCGRGSDYMPVAWSPKDTKIILRLVPGPACGAGYLVNSILDVKTLEEYSLPSYAPIFFNDYKEVVYLNISHTKGFCGMGMYSDKIIKENIENGEKVILAESEDEVYSDLILLPNGDLEYKAHPGSVDPQSSCFESDLDEFETRTLKLE